MPPSKKIHVARWDNFQYGQSFVDRGQVIELSGSRNDDKLLRLGYITESTEKEHTLLTCGECEAIFISDNSRNAHGRRRHPQRARRAEMVPVGPFDPSTGLPSAYEDTEGDREDRQRAKDTPLYIENSTASREV